MLSDRPAIDPSASPAPRPAPLAGIALPPGPGRRLSATMSASPGSAPFTSFSRRRRITRPSLCAGITTVVTSKDYARPRPAADSNWRCARNLFPRPQGHSTEYPGVYPDIHAGLLRSMMRNPSARGILAIRHGRCLHGWMPDCCRYASCPRSSSAPYGLPRPPHDLPRDPWPRKAARLPCRRAPRARGQLG